MNLHGLVYVVGAVSLIVAGQTLLKSGMTLVGPVDLGRVSRPVALARTMLAHWQVWLGTILYLVSAATWILALATVPLSIAYPVLGLSYVAVAGLSVFVLGEWLTPAQWLGIAFVVAGVVIVTLS